MGLDKYQVNNNGDGIVKIIMSCTSTQNRLHIFRYGILSLLRQTLQPDLLLINLNRDTFDNVSDVHQCLPECAHADYIKVNLVEDVGPHTKLLPALEFASASDLIITVDDDVIYSQTLVQDLVDASRGAPNAICCTRARRVVQESNGNFAKYRSWPNIKTAAEGMDILPLGVGGVAYKRQFFDEQFLVDPAFRHLAPSADDLWFRVASLINRTPVRVDPELDLGNMRIHHRLGLEQINLGQSVEKFRAPIIQRLSKKIRHILFRQKEIEVSKNDLQWQNAVAYATSLGKRVYFEIR